MRPLDRQPPVRAMFGVLLVGLVSLQPAAVLADPPARIVDDAPIASLWSWEGLVWLLGGLEASWGGGSASATSGIDAGDFGELEVASGQVDQQVWGVSLYGGPVETGFTLKPTAGFLSQRIAVADFFEEVPLVDDLDAQDIGARCTNPDTGEVLDCANPNVYDLDLRSFYAGAQGGYDLIWGHGAIRGVFGAAVNLNVAEVRLLDVSFAGQRQESTDLSFFRSWGLSATAGVAFPTIRTVIRVIGTWQDHTRFEYEAPLEFRGPVIYDADLNVYKRPRMFVRDVDLSIFDTRIAAAWIF